MAWLTRFLRLDVLEDRSVPSIAGDFNGDGFGDLAVGVAGANHNEMQDVGAVHILYGKQDLMTNRVGLSADNTQLIMQDTFAWPLGEVEDGDRFGEALAVGNFNNDKYSDLAISSPGESYGDIPHAGLVHVLYGSSDGLTGEGGQAFRQGLDIGGKSKVVIGDMAEHNDQFGLTLTVGDFDGDKRDDLAIGVPDEDADAFNQDSGLVHVLSGSSTGLDRATAQSWTQDNDGTSEFIQGGDRFGASLASGDFNGDSKDELAIGVPLELVKSASFAGGVLVLPGSSSGLTAVGSKFWTQDSYGIADVVEFGDEFGSTLATGDFNGDGKDDLAIGAQSEGLGIELNAGAVNVIHGSGTGLTPTFNQFWHENSPGIQGASQENDFFGATLASGDFNGDGKDDLAIGVPNEGVGGIAEAGAVHVLYGSTNRLSSNFSQFWAQGNSFSTTLGAGESREEGDHFGTTLAVGDFDGNGKSDLVIGVPNEDLDGVVAAGGVHVLYGSANRLSPLRMQFWSQADLGIFGDPADGFGSSLGGR